MGILKKPYDPEEYDKLLEEVYSRKPVIEDREMRNGRTRLCPAQRMGKSYVDLHQGNVIINICFSFILQMHVFVLLIMHKQCLTNLRYKL